MSAYADWREAVLATQKDVQELQSALHEQRSLLAEARREIERIWVVLSEPM